MFVPILFLGGVGGYLFAPLALAVIFAMMASYFLSRTLVPTMVLYLLAAEERQMKAPPPARRSIFRRIGDRLRGGVRKTSPAPTKASSTGRWNTAAWWSTALLAVRAVIAVPVPVRGARFLPDAWTPAMLRLHVRCPPGTRIEQSEVYFQHVEDYIRQVIPANELSVIDDNIGLPNNINLARSDSVTAGPSDGEILVALNANHHPTADYLKTIRAEFPQRFPDLQLFTQPADIVSQILNFGLPAPIDIQVSGPIGESDKNYQSPSRSPRNWPPCPARWTFTSSRSPVAPRIMIDTDRTLAQQNGLTETRHRQQPVGLADRQRDGHHQLLAELQERRQLPGGRADAAVPGELDGPAEPHADRRWRGRRTRSS